MKNEFGRIIIFVNVILVSTVFLFSCTRNGPVSTPEPTSTSGVSTIEPTLKSTESEKVPITFEFLAAADYGATDYTNATLNSMAVQPSDFALVIGDLSYSHLEPESAWCDYMKGYFGNEFPIEILAGNHEDDGPNGIIDNFASCLPDRLGAKGSYAKQYYFDYPADTPIARFIMISPDLTIDGEKYRYSAGSPRYDWLVETIDDARAQSIPWVILGIHKVCLTIGTKPCEIGTDLNDLIIEKKVDLVLHGHEHNYERTKQLTLGPECKSVSPHNFNPSCVANDTFLGVVTKDRGTIFMIVGNAGRSNYNLDPGSPIAGYFATWAGDDGDQVNGYAKITVSSDYLVTSFISTVGEYSDNLIIKMEGSLPGAAPTAVPTPTPLPTPIPSPTSSPIPSEVIVIPVIADATIREDKPDSNYGLGPKLEADLESRKDFLLKFDVSGITGRRVLASRIMLYNVDDSGVGGDFYSTDNTWDEETVTWNNAPVSGSRVSVIGPVSAGNWYEANLGGFLTEDGVYSFRISSNSANGADYSSRQDPEHAPYLEVVVELPASSSQLSPLARSITLMQAIRIAHRPFLSNAIRMLFLALPFLE